MCISPLILKNEERPISGDATRKVPCGKCVTCLKRRSNGWVFRLKQEQKISTNISFITLTYENTPYSNNGLPSLDKQHLQKFIKRLRSHKGRKFPNFPKLKYYACGEYGSETYRPHYHAIIFNLPQEMVNNTTISQIWQHGISEAEPAEEGSIRYVTKYISKNTFQDKEIVCTETGELIEDDRIPEFSVMSKNLGINFLTPQMIKYLQNRLASSVKIDGYEIAIPRYYKEKIFTKEQKKLLTEQAEIARNHNFEKLFNNSYKHEDQWKKSQLRKQREAQRKERIKL